MINKEKGNFYIIVNEERKILPKYIRYSLENNSLKMKYRDETLLIEIEPIPISLYEDDNEKIYNKIIIFDKFISLILRLKKIGKDLDKKTTSIKEEERIREQQSLTSKEIKKLNIEVLSFTTSTLRDYEELKIKIGD